MSRRNLTIATGCSRSLILSILTDDVVAEIFAMLGPRGTAQCSAVCQQWNRVSQESRCLWHHFVAQDFQFTMQQPEPGNDGNRDTTSDWRRIYAYLTERAEAYQRDEDHDEQQSQTSSFSTQNPSLPIRRPPRYRGMLNAHRVLLGRVLFSDDGSAIPGYPPENAIRPCRGAWCTNSQVDHDVDLVIDLNEPCLIGGFEAANGGSFYSAPLKEALVFASIHPINLDQARRFNGAAGSTWVQRIVSAGDSSASNDLERQYHHDQQQREQHHDKGSNAASHALLPVAAFRFPPVPAAFGARLYHKLERPMVSRYIHFKLLSSYNSNDGRVSDNIDVLDLHICGVDLKELPKLVQKLKLCDTRQPADPSYKRLHQIRTYVPIDEPMDGVFDIHFGHRMNPNNLEWMMF